MNNTTTKKIIIDCQVFQTPAYHRGMGKYSFSLLEAILEKLKVSKDYQPIFLFNSSIKQNREVRRALRSLAPQARFLDISLSTPKEPRARHSVQQIRLENEIILTTHLETLGLGKKVDFLILALYLDEVCSVFPKNDFIDKKALIYYDAIPYLYPNRYGVFKGFFENFYLPHTASLFEANMIFTISKTVANDLHIMFGIPDDVIHNIDGASIPRATNLPVKPEGFDIEEGSFILMPSGQEQRKNNMRAVEAFDEFCSRYSKDYTLVVTSFFTEDARAAMQARSGRVIFTGNVSEAELLWLYKKSRFILFASEYEGLGLPVLEAVEENKLVACSDISVFREMSKTAFYMFNPLSTHDISEGIRAADQAVLEDNNKTDQYKAIVKKYTWPRTADAFLDAMRTHEVWQPVEIKKKIALLCPDPSGFSAIGKVIAESHAWYSRYFDIDYYFDSGPGHTSMRPNFLTYAVKWERTERFDHKKAQQYDAVIYHIGNSEYHHNIIHAALGFPGYVVLHDTNLEGAFQGLEREGIITEQRLHLEETLEKRIAHASKKPRNGSFLASIANSQKAIITHSEYASRAVLDRIVVENDIVVQKINLPVDTPIHEELIGDNDEKLNISLAGIVAKVKGTDIIKAVAASPDYEHCKINIFGYRALESGLLNNLHTLSHVNVVTSPSDFEFQQLMAKTDILLNVREEYRGETSLTTLEQLRFGGAVIVKDVGWYGELPDDIVIKVKDSKGALDALTSLIKDSNRRASMRAASLRYVRENHSHQSYAEKMYKIIDDQTQS